MTKRIVLLAVCAVIIVSAIVFIMPNVNISVTQPSDENPDIVVTEPPISDDLPETDAPETDDNDVSQSLPPEGDIPEIDDISDEVQTEPDQEVEYPADATVRICIIGDTTMDSEFADVSNQYGIDYPWRQVSELLNSADLTVANLETCVSETGESEKDEGYGFRTPPEMLQGFVDAGIDVVNLANNHVRDFGYQALLDTFDNLDEYGIEYFGAGHDYDEAAGLLIKEINGVKIGFTGCNRVWLTEDCAAADGHAGINQVHSLSKESTQAYLAKIKEYDEMVDVLICIAHYGVEETFEVTSYQKELSRALIDNGVDIFIGGHSHTLQPIEYYNGKPIIYSIGNFIFWHIDDDIDGLSAVFDFTVNREGVVSLQLHPVFIKRYRANLMEKGSDRYEQILTLMNNMCNPNGIAFDEDGYMVEYIPPEPTETGEVTDDETLPL